VDGQEPSEVRPRSIENPSDLTVDEWAYVELLIPPAKRGGGTWHTDMRAVMNGVMYILSTGSLQDGGDPDAGAGGMAWQGRNTSRGWGDGQTLTAPARAGLQTAARGKKRRNTQVEQRNRSRKMRRSETA
jgi:hypothetical protein